MDWTRTECNRIEWNQKKTPCCGLLGAGGAGSFFVFWGVGWSSGQCSFRAGVGAVLGSAVQCWCGLVQFSDQCRCGFRASVGAVLVWCGAVFILNGMIFSFLDEKRVFKGVV